MKLEINLKMWILPFAALVFLFGSCREEKAKSKPDDYFSKGQQNALLAQIVQKTAKKPESAISPEEEKAYYDSQSKSYEWHFVHERGGRYYYFVSRPAPSLYGKRAGLAGVFESPDGMKISGFKEVFHTFKMKPDQLLQKGSVLFEKMVNGESLEAYQPGKKGEEEWIEFPDQLNRYDSLNQKWVFGPGDAAK